MPNPKNAVNLRIINGNKLEGVTATDHTSSLQTVIGLDHQTGAYTAEECKIDFNGDVECIVSNEQWLPQHVFNYLKSLIKTTDPIAFSLNNVPIDRLEFNRTVINAEFAANLDDSVLINARKISKELAEQIDEISKRHYITKSEYSTIDSSIRKASHRTK